MNWNEWLAVHHMDIDTGDDTLDNMKKAYIAGLQQAYDLVYMNEDGDIDFIRYRLKNLIKESK